MDETKRGGRTGDDWRKAVESAAEHWLGALNTALKNGPPPAVQVVGIEHHGGAQALEGLRPGDKLRLVREPENKFDAKAIAVVRPDTGARIGYLGKRDAAIYASGLDEQGGECEATVVEVCVEKSRLCVGGDNLPWVDEPDDVARD